MLQNVIVKPLHAVKVAQNQEERCLIYVVGELFSSL